MSTSSEWIAKEQKYYAQTVRRQPVVIVRGEGTKVWDADGKEYLDFVAGWAVDNLGHSHPTITQAIVEQAGTLLQTSTSFTLFRRSTWPNSWWKTVAWTRCFSATAALKPTRAP